MSHQEFHARLKVRERVVSGVVNGEPFVLEHLLAKVRAKMLDPELARTVGVQLPIPDDAPPEVRAMIVDGFMAQFLGQLEALIAATGFLSIDAEFDFPDERRDDERERGPVGPRGGVEQPVVRAPLGVVV